MTGPRAIRRRLALAALAAAAVLAAATPAAAAPYTVESCRDAAGGPLSTAAWVPAGHPDRRSDTCATGGALEIVAAAADTTPAVAVSGYRFAVPRGVTLVGYEAWVAAMVRNDPYAHAHYMAGLGQGDELAVPTTLHGCYTNAAACDEGDFDVPLSSVNHTGPWPVVWHGLGLMIACASVNGHPCAPGADPPARTALFRSVVTLDDPSSPAIGPLGGTLVGSGPASGVRTVTATVTDQGSGVARVELLVDGAVADARDAGGTCVRPYVVADPCASVFPVAFALDTTGLAPGAHAVAVRAVDAAGNASQSAPAGVVVDNAPAPPRVVVVPAPAPPPVVVAAAPSTEEESPDRPLVTVELRAREEVAVPTPRPVVGRVLGSDGTPRAGVAVHFERRPFGTRRWRSWGDPASSGPDGRFRVPVPDDSAEVRVRATGAQADPILIRFVRPLGVTIRTSDDRLRNGERLTLAGRVRHAGGTEGITVLVQSRVRGAWRTVDSVETGAAGRARWRYRFTNTRRTARYRFRFVVRPGPALPWRRTVSDVVAVVVSGEEPAPPPRRARP